MGKRSTEWVEGAPYAHLVVSSAGTLHVIDWGRPHCRTNDLERPVKGREKSPTTYAVLDDDDIRARKWTEVCALCEGHPSFRGLLNLPPDAG